MNGWTERHWFLTSIFYGHNGHLRKKKSKKFGMTYTLKMNALYLIKKKIGATNYKQYY